MKRNILRQKAKKAYREAAKTVPKKQRMPFALFYKNFMKAMAKDGTEVAESKEDFNLEDLININDINEDEE